MMIAQTAQKLCAYTVKTIQKVKSVKYTKIFKKVVDIAELLW